MQFTGPFYFSNDRTANTIGKTVYQIKLRLLDDYMQQQLRSPSLRYLEPNIA
ncbi:hypothetical protein [Rickettsia endosymbiont of Gonocerus acuteangulatus]|uniref:hypothetical protein n=1 Tax=Rickettsia endosymbiont of Gonocerus acuteangulatus TaxID=3066266 RepID=UPI003133522A